MTAEEIKKIIEIGLANSKASVSEDAGKFEATVISKEFEGLSIVKQHQMIYKLLNKHIASGAIHALTIKSQSS